MHPYFESNQFLVKRHELAQIVQSQSPAKRRVKANDNHVKTQANGWGVFTHRQLVSLALSERNRFHNRHRLPCLDLPAVRMSYRLSLDRCEES